jgi:hypothetical protein
MATACIKCFTAKTAKKSLNASPASPVNTRTAERAFKREILWLHLDYSERRPGNCVYSLLAPRDYPFRRPCIHG